MPRSLIPWGQPKLSSMPSAPVSSVRRTMSCQASRVLSTISEAITACSGYARLTAAISLRLSSIGRSVMSSMLLNPIMRVVPRSTEP